MDLATGIVSSVLGLYKEINPSNLSGVNDIIVVEGKDGVMRCTPFEVRFGKLQMFRITSRTVHIYVNGKMTDVVMNIGYQGELYFEMGNPTNQANDTPIGLEVNYIANNIKEQYSCSNLDDMFQNRFGYTNSFNSIEEASDRSINTGGASLYTKSFIEYERSRNLEKRKFAKKKLEDETDQYKKLITSNSNFGKLINSFNYFGLVLRNTKILLHILKGLWLYPTENHATKCPRIIEGGCREARIRFSLCINEKIENDIETDFEGCEVHEIRDQDKLVVQLSGCKVCSMKFYFDFNFFTRAHFLVKSTLSKPDQEFILTDFLEKEAEKKQGWSLFTKSKPKKEVIWTLELTSDQLKHMNLIYGTNDLIFKLSGINERLKAKIFLWNQDEKVIVSDIDGTITKSDVRGHVYNIFGKDWTHNGVANLYKKISQNGYRFIYLTTRPLGQSKMTRLYLQSIEQDGGKLPEGPIVHSPVGIFSALYREIVLRNPQDFKIAYLKKIESLFVTENPFVAGFGNKITDVITYKEVGIPLSKIFTINRQGEIVLELNKSMKITHKSLKIFVDVMFPKLNIGKIFDFDNKFNDSSFWKIPYNLFDRQ